MSKKVGSLALSFAFVWPVFVWSSMVFANASHSNNHTFDLAEFANERVQELKQPIIAFLTRGGSKAAAQEALNENTKNVSRLLGELGYRHATRGVPSELQPSFKDLTFNVHRILPDQKTKLGQFAQTIGSRFGVDVIYAPLLLEVVGGTGVFIESGERPMLVVTADSVFTDSVDSFDNGHEQIHMKFWAFRNGLQPEFFPKAPVHTTFSSAEAINPQASIGIYQKFMSFEELVAFGFNISRCAENVSSSTADPGEIESEIEPEVAKLKIVSENAIIAAQKGLAALQLREPKRLKPTGQLAGAYFEIENGDFTLKVFLSKSDDLTCNENKSQCPRLLAQKLEASIRLAQFNLDYFSKQETTDRFLQKAKAFERAQSAFTQQLP